MEAAGWRNTTIRSASEAAGVLDLVISLMASAEYSAVDRFAVKLALQEALTNALTHGNRGDPTKKVWLRYRVDRNWVQIEVTDEGAGFEPSAVPDPTAPQNQEQTGGRGLYFMRAYMTECHFSKKGNRVTLGKARSAL